MTIRLLYKEVKKVYQPVRNWQGRHDKTESETAVNLARNLGFSLGFRSELIGLIWYIETKNVFLPEVWRVVCGQVKYSWRKVPIVSDQSNIWIDLEGHGVIITIEINIFSDLNATLVLVVIRILPNHSIANLVKYQINHNKPSRNTVLMIDCSN